MDESNRLHLRFWDTQENRMLYSGDLDCPDMTANGCPVESRTRKNLSVRMKPLQSTGLVDKNGKEVFEGDVLTITEDDFTGRNWEVKWLGRGAAFHIDDGNCIMSIDECLFEHVDGNDVIQIATIIGNRYENPELLNN